MQDYDYLHSMSQGIKNIITYGTKDAEVEGNIQAVDPFVEVRFTKGFEGTIHTSLVGGYNLPNVLAAVAVGKHFGVANEKIKAAIEAYKPSNSRSQLVIKGSHKIIVDAYNANPSSMKLAIENFARAAGNHKILALGAMAELGSESLQEHQSIIDLIGQHHWQDVVLVGGDFQKIKHPYKSFSTAAEAGQWISQQLTAPSYLLIKGSRSMQMEKVLDYIKE
jgi:UDP-N-acetylmuramoyl-tripeptide--D-alanyl-D-alanine ligase